MAVSCAKCGRQYDVTLFQFGRTINCACGARVGFEHKIELSAAAADELKFFADVNAARLVRWLRAVGIDTVWEDAIPDADLVRRAIEERRYVLTLDKRLVREFRADNLFLLSSDEPLEQFRETVRRFKIPAPGALFTRCLVCNTPLRRAESAEIAGNAVPDRARAGGGAIYFCPGCRRIYWEGSHTRRMRAAIEEIFRRTSSG